jgi:hypothetical protein
MDRLAIIAEAPDIGGSHIHFLAMESGWENQTKTDIGKTQAL